MEKIKRRRRTGVTDKLNTFDKLFEAAKEKLGIRTFSQLASSIQAAGYMRDYKQDTLAQYMRDCRFEHISRIDSKFLIFCAISTILKELNDSS